MQKILITYEISWFIMFEQFSINSMAYIEWDYTVITSMVEKQGWNLPERESEEWNKFKDELGEKMRGVGIVFEKYCKFTPDVGEGVHLLDE